MREAAITKGKFRMEAISEYRGEIYGISIFWIMLFHLNESHYYTPWKDNAVFHYILNVIKLGNMGVDIFLFLSGICLYFSFTKNPDVLNFLKKRLSRILYPLFLTSGIWWIWYLLSGKISIWGMTNRLSLVQFWISKDSQVWFASLIMALYLLYPYIYFFLFEKKNDKSILLRTIGLLAFSVIVTVGIYMEAPEVYENLSRALPRLAVFVTGCYAGKYVYEKKHISVWIPIVSWLLFLVALAASWKMGLRGSLVFRYVYWIGGVAFAFFLAVFFCYMPRWFNKIWSCLGAISLEQYFTHVVLRRVLKETPLCHFAEDRYLFKILFVLIGAFIWAEITAKLVTWLKAKRKAN